MIDIPVHNAQGQQVDTLQVDEQQLGGEIRPGLLKQAYVRFHANRRHGAARTRTRSELSRSSQKLYRQKGTGNARHGDANANLMRGGGHTFAKRPKSWRQGMPKKMRRLANRNALLAKAVDQEIKVIDKFEFDQPRTRQFAEILKNLNIDRSCLVAFTSATGPEALSARNLDNVTLTLIERLNAFDLLNHRYLLVEAEALSQWIAAGGPAHEMVDEQDIEAQAQVAAAETE